jgi:hypothetical protein
MSDKRTYLTVEVTPQLKRAVQRAARRRVVTVSRLVIVALCRDCKLDLAKMLNGRRLA